MYFCAHGSGLHPLKMATLLLKVQWCSQDVFYSILALLKLAFLIDRVKILKFKKMDIQSTQKDENKNGTHCDFHSPARVIMLFMNYISLIVPNLCILRQAHLILIQSYVDDMIKKYLSTLMLS